MQPLDPGEDVSPRFRITARLGTGGMGEVWSAWDSELQERVALKFINQALSARPEILALLKRECRNSRRLVHPNIVRVYDFHRSGQRAFVSMELIEGRSLAELTGAPYAWVIGKLLPILDALAYAHGLGIIHRDVKASNILLDRSGTPRLVDFGISGLRDPGGADTEPGAGGSPHAMSPQQRAGEPPRPADDMYACGALLFELLAGHPAPLTDQRLPTDPTRPDGLDRTVLRMLAHDPNDRPASMEELRAALEPYADVDTNLTVPPSNLVPQKPATSVGPGRGPKPRRESDYPAGPAPRRKHLPARIIVPAFMLLLAAVMGVFLVLPEYVEERHGRAPAPAEREALPRPGERPKPAREQPETTVQLPAQPPASAVDEQAANDALGAYLLVLARLEEMLVSRWAPEQYADAEARAADGDHAMRNGAYTEARGFFEQATGILQQLSADTEIILAEALIRGQQALANGDGQSAQEAFEIALAIDPENQTAADGLVRARTIDEVFALVASGEAHEADGHLAFAHTDYAAALEMDRQNAKARASLERVRERMVEEDFQATMSDAFSALERRDFPQALDAFQSAGAIRPNSPAVADGLAQAAEGMRLASIEARRKKAARLEADERWAEAAAQYEAALAIEPSLVFAQDGKARTLERARITAKLKYYLDNPELLNSQRVRENALSFLGKAGTIEPKGPEFRRGIAALQKQILVATRPLSLELRSDGATEIVVYRLGRLGRFTSREISLRPGTYAIVGSRPGYKDVRREIIVTAGKPLQPLYVACEEPI